MALRLRFVADHFGAFLRPNFAGAFCCFLISQVMRPAASLLPAHPLPPWLRPWPLMSFYNVPVLIWFLSPMSTDIPRIPKRIVWGCTSGWVHLSASLCQTVICLSHAGQKSQACLDPGDILAEILITDWRVDFCGDFECDTHWNWWINGYIQLVKIFEINRRMIIHAVYLFLIMLLVYCKYISFLNTKNGRSQLL